MALRFTSVLERAHRRELEKLLFQHPQQGRFRDTILESIERFGVPRVVELNRRLRIKLSGQVEVQTIYALMEGALRSDLAAVVVYSRNAEDELVVMHLAVENDYTTRGPRADQMVTYAIIDELCRIARHIKGVCGVRLAYARGQSILKTVHPLSFPSILVTDHATPRANQPIEEVTRGDSG